MRAIDSDELMDRVNFILSRIKSPALVETFLALKEHLEKTPTLALDDIRPHGRWVAQDETLTRFMCSVCEAKNYGGYEKFCPNCGAKMDKEAVD